MLFNYFLKICSILVIRFSSSFSVCFFFVFFLNEKQRKKQLPGSTVSNSFLDPTKTGLFTLMNVLSDLHFNHPHGTLPAKAGTWGQLDQKGGGDQRRSATKT